MKVSFQSFRENPDAQPSLEMAAAAYDDESTYVRLQGAYDGQAILHDDGRQLTIAFRGTESVTDWIRNILRYRTACPYISGATVHAGFLSQYIGLQKQVMDHVRRSRATRIVVTGHSLGGALATLCAVELATQFMDKMLSCYVFASPRVGDRRFVEAAEKLANLTILRIHVQKDLVTNLPYFGFVHTPCVTYAPFRSSGWGIFHLRARHSLKSILKSLKMKSRYTP